MTVMYFRDDDSGKPYDKLYTLENVRGISISVFQDKLICEDVNGIYTIIDLQNVWIITDRGGTANA